MPLSPSSMASSIPHHFYQNNFTFTSSDLSDLIPIPFNSMWGASHQLEDNINGFHNFPVIDENNLDHVFSLDFDTMACANWIPTNNIISDQIIVGGNNNNNIISDCNKMGFYGTGGIQNLNGRSSSYQLPHVIVGEFGDECCGFLDHDVKPTPANNFSNSAATENWGIKGNQMAAVEEPNIKVGRYSEEERKERILRYLKKRNQRNFNKTIKYACRKTLADRRVRVRGRFARNNELCDNEDNNMAVTKKDQNHHKEDDFYNGAHSIQFQLKNDEEDWLQEAMASLVYLSHSSSEDM